jgi:uncharacterized protein
MATNIFVNLPVANLDASKAFFGKLGFAFNPQFTDETAAAMVIEENIFAMLLTHEKFAQFTPKTIADARTTSEVLIALSRDSKDGVHEMFDKAIAAGGLEVRPADDYGFMVSRAFSDLDGHIWEIMWMDPSYVQGS